jgi:TP53 regulating kinase-like protein
VYKGNLHPEELDKGTEPIPVLLKYRFKKQYRHPSLDVSLTRSRVAGEARALMKCLRCVFVNNFRRSPVNLNLKPIDLA